MGSQMEKRKAWMRFLSVFLFCSSILVLIFGSAYARFEENTSKELKFTYQAGSEQIYITTVDSSEHALNTVKNENTQIVEFVLSNGTGEEQYCTQTQIAELAVFATIGVETPESFEISLHDGGNIYKSSCQEVMKDSTLHSMYGPGWIYRFYNEAGEEVTWNFPGTHFMSRQMFITIDGTSVLPAAMNLIASARPGA